MFILTCILSVERKFWTTMEAFDRQRDTLVWARQMRLVCLTSTNCMSAWRWYDFIQLNHVQRIPCFSFIVVYSLLCDDKLLDEDGIREQAYLIHVSLRQQMSSGSILRRSQSLSLYLYNWFDYVCRKRGTQYTTYKVFCSIVVWIQYYDGLMVDM